MMTMMDDNLFLVSSVCKGEIEAFYYSFRAYELFSINFSFFLSFCLIKQITTRREALVRRRTLTGSRLYLRTRRELHSLYPRVVL